MSSPRTRTAISFLLVLSATLSAPGPTAAQVYRWTDSRGQVHFSDNPNQAPPRQQVGVRQPASSPAGSEAPQAQAGAPGASRPAGVQTVEALTGLDAAARSGVPYAEYVGHLADTRAVVERNLPQLGGPARSAVVGALACYKNAADAWSVYNASKAPWAANVVQRALACGSTKTAEARRYLSGGEEGETAVNAVRMDPQQ